ncbi:MAG: GlsB/YeaQ/YmgE family stress response membrane protein, partial [Candidatus Peribacteraceae bacterium]|nr:GlsB/YeaQ/YmgE family stress response membrane protein [Candidatus Peribacteraceae bacterium]
AFIIIGIIAGWVAGLIMKGRGFGMIGDLVVGVIGAVIGGFLLRLLGIDAYGTVGTLVMATVGAVVFLGLAAAIKRA